MQLAGYLQLSLTFIAMAMRHTYCSVAIGMTPRTTVMTTTRLDCNAVSDVGQCNTGTAFCTLALRLNMFLQVDMISSILLYNPFHCLKDQ